MSQARPANAPHPVDIHVGRRLRERRLVKGRSQEQLAAGLGVSLAQYRRYENGSNRLAASRLHDLAAILGVPVPYFFEDMPASIALRPPAKARGGRRTTAGASHVPAGEKRQDEQITADLVDAYHRIGTKGVRRKLLELMQRLGDMCAELDALEREALPEDQSIEPPSADCG